VDDVRRADEMADRCIRAALHSRGISREAWLMFAEHCTDLAEALLRAYVRTIVRGMERSDENA